MRGNGTSASSVVDGSSTGASAATSADAVGPDGPATNRALDAVKVTEFIGWLAIAGSALALVGFLLPWSTSVIGASGVSYLDRWGFAGPGHILIAIGLAGVLVAAVLRDRVPLWLGIGMPGLGLGALVIGLAWPYLVGPLGGQIGVVTVTLGSVLLVVAGLLAIILEQRARHAEDGPTV
jgi:hypothetical protein